MRSNYWIRFVLAPVTASRSYQLSVKFRRFVFLEMNAKKQRSLPLAHYDFIQKAGNRLSFPLSLFLFLDFSGNMTLNAQGILAAVSIALYVPFLLVSIKLVAKYGILRGDGWFMLLIFCIRKLFDLFQS
jgi:hypothetical protein